MSNAKFYQGNQGIFLKYFDGTKYEEPSQQYNRLVNDGKFKEIEETIKAKSEFSFENWLVYLKEDRLAEFKL
jgi:hypothetical protein